MHVLKIGITFAMLLFIQAACHARTVTVHKGGVGDFTTLADAIAGTSANDIISIIDSGTYAESVSISNRILSSNPPGATITGTLTVTGGVGSSVIIEDIFFKNSIDGIHFYGDGPDFSPNIGSLAVTRCVFSDIINHGILLNLANNGILNLNNCIFANCGRNGLTLWRNCDILATDCTFQSNGLGGSGDAGIFVDGDNNNSLGRKLTLSNVTFTGNLNGIKSWRKINLNGNNVTITQSLLEGISVDGQAGGSVIFLTNSNVNANNDRGITCFRGMTVAMQNSSISANGSYGIFIEDFGEGPDFGFAPFIALDHCQVLDNIGRGVTHQGKAAVNSAIVITDSRFTGNADRLFSCQAGTGKITMVMQRNIFRSPTTTCIPVFAWNTAAQSKIEANLVDGGLVGLALSEGSVDAINNTIVNSSAGGIVVSSDSGIYPITIHNNIVAQCGSGIRAAGDGTGFNNVSVDYNLVQFAGAGPAIDSAFNVGTHNNTADSPGFVAASTTVALGDYHLASSSAARNAGNPAFVPASDLDGKAYNSASPDLGAYVSTSGINSWQAY